MSNDNKKPFVVGLTGGIGSGKSAAAQIFGELGAYIIDTDKVSKAVMAEATECNTAVKAAFKECVAGGILQRALLKSYVFANDDARRLLNSITHPYIFAETVRQADGHKLVVIQVPLLFESGFDKLCDVTVCVNSSKDIRIGRVQKRDNINTELIAAIMSTQLPPEELIQKCDYSIDNNGDFTMLEKNTKAVFEKIKNRLLDIKGL